MASFFDARYKIRQEECLKRPNVAMRTFAQRRLRYLLLSLISLILVAAALSILPSTSYDGVAGKSRIEADPEWIYSDVSIDNMRNTIRSLEQLGERSSWGMQNRAIAWAEKQFQEFGLNTWIETYESNGRTWSNCFARINGIENSSQLILLTAHIDSISDRVEKGVPGADDNGSGVAVLLESARIFERLSPSKSVLFCIFSNEEQGRLGSKAFAAKAREQGLDIRAVINVDALGYNRAFSNGFWRGVFNGNSIKDRARIIARLVQNAFLELKTGNDTILVAGRPANRGLVSVTAGGIREASRLNVKERVGDDCA